MNNSLLLHPIAAIFRKVFRALHIYLLTQLEAIKIETIPRMMLSAGATVAMISF